MYKDLAGISSSTRTTCGMLRAMPYLQQRCHLQRSALVPAHWMRWRSDPASLFR